MSDPSALLTNEDEDVGQCFTVCENNVTTAFEQPQEDVTFIKLLTGPHGNWIEDYAKRFVEYKQGKVKLDIVTVGFDQLFPDLINEAASQVGIFDVYVTPPTVTGSVVEHDGWADLTPYILATGEQSSDWSDILLGYRKWVAQYEGKIIMYPLDGDLLSMFYRKDVLQHYGLSVPRTWDEYNEVAAYVHGKEFEGQVLTGSCVGRLLTCGANPYWANLLISSMTQRDGTWSGHLFDTDDMTPLTGATIVKALEWMELQVKYGDAGEFDNCITPGNTAPMKQGRCVLTYNWGDTFKAYLQEPTTLRGKMGVAPTPGSRQVLDRTTKTLVDCTPETCQYGTDHEDIGRVNRAPYMAFGGWGCAVNNYTSPKKKMLATEFCAFASSKRESIASIVPNATAPLQGNGQNPYRLSHLSNLNTFVQQGYEQDTAQQFIDAILAGLDSDNVVTDIRFPQASNLMGVLGREFHDYLNLTRLGLIPDNELADARWAVSNRIEQEWATILRDYDEQGSTQISVLDSYQRLRGVYVRNYDLNQIDSIRIYGFLLAGFAIASALAFGMWTLYARKAHVVQASQPFFLVILCFGGILFSSTIIPMGIDDSIASVEAASRACMAIPWLASLGWTGLFAALYAKLWRVNRVFKNSLRFKRVKVKVKDVMLPFAILMTCNITVLTIWTSINPLKWKRIETSDTSSYGTCAADGSAVWKVCAALIVAANGIALILANLEAYKARNVSTEFGESKYIAMVMGSIVQIALVGLPTIFLVHDNPAASYFIRSSIVFVVCMSILTLIFVPKVYIWIKKPNDKRSMRKRGGRDSGVGLTVQVLTTEMALRASNQNRKFQQIERELQQLERVMREQGLDVNRLFAEVGLGTVASRLLEMDISTSSHFGDATAHSELQSTAHSLPMRGDHALWMVREASCEEDSEEFWSDSMHERRSNAPPSLVLPPLDEELEDCVIDESNGSLNLRDRAFLAEMRSASERLERAKLAGDMKWFSARGLMGPPAPEPEQQESQYDDVTRSASERRLRVPREVALRPSQSERRFQRYAPEEEKMATEPEKFLSAAARGNRDGLVRKGSFPNSIPTIAEDKSTSTSSKEEKQEQSRDERRSLSPKPSVFGRFLGRRVASERQTGGLPSGVSSQRAMSDRGLGRVAERSRETVPLAIHPNSSSRESNDSTLS